jgi:hypothetical protein
MTEVFEDRKRSMDEILSLFFITLYLWTVAYVTLLSISYSVFLNLFVSSS